MCHLHPQLLEPLLLIHRGPTSELGAAAPPRPGAPLAGPRGPSRAPRMPAPHRSPPGAGWPRSLAETRGCCSDTRSRCADPGRPATQSTAAQHRSSAPRGAAPAPPGQPAAAPAGGSSGRIRAGEPGGPERPRPPPLLAGPAAASPHPFLPPGCTNLRPLPSPGTGSGAGSDVFRPRPGRPRARLLPVLVLRPGPPAGPPRALLLPAPGAHPPTRPTWPGPRALLPEPGAPLQTRPPGTDCPFQRNAGELGLGGLSNPKGAVKNPMFHQFFPTEGSGEGGVSILVRWFNVISNINYACWK